jgi:two-component system, chemotaxis family, chemotaxis protein CheY
MATILVIDNDAAVRGLFQTVLQSVGHAVSVAANAAEGLDVLRGSAIEMVITDLNMPEGTGLDVISKVRQDFPTTKVLVVSDEASDDDPLQTSSSLDAVEVLPKPVGVSHLLGTVNRVLGCNGS